MLPYVAFLFKHIRPEEGHKPGLLPFTIYLKPGNQCVGSTNACQRTACYHALQTGKLKIHNYVG